MAKTLQKIIGPNAWRTLWRILYKQIPLFIENIVKYRNFSFNLNTKGYWNNKLSRFGHFWRDEHYRNILNLFPQDKAFSLLDIGCAIGNGCELLHEKFPRAKITGVDLSEVGIEKAKQNTKAVQYFVLNILKDPIPEKYDYITIIETLEHFDKPFVVVDKCLKHVKESIIISTPYSPHFSGRIRRRVEEHRYFFNEKTFANYNYRVVKITESKPERIIYEIRP
jgi:2-polyprenyl-3-methyl-5-hydroxy-6-metoxy-1,4-benzoquinol methylase